MSKIQAGNTFDILWSIYVSNAPYDLRQKDLTFTILDPYGVPFTAENFTICGANSNVIRWRFEGKDQRLIGRYTLILIENNGKADMRTLDKRNAFQLVQHSDQAQPQNDSKINIETIELHSSFAIDGSYSEKAYEVIKGWIGKNIDIFLDSLVIVVPEFGAQTILDPTAFQYIVAQYGLAERQGIPLPCLFKKERFEQARFGILFYREILGEKRMDIMYHDCPIPSDEDARKNGELIWSPNVAISAKNLAYLYSPGTKSLITLGIGYTDSSTQVTQLSRQSESLLVRVKNIEEYLKIKT